jgi:predicted nucleic acid-binding protein
MVLADLAAGVLAVASPALMDIVAEGERLSALHSEKLGTRSLDILHVASAVVLGSTSFVTFDRRQAALARASGLKVPR